MKVAILLAGQMRTYKDCSGSLVKMLAEPLNADIFISTWSKFGHIKSSLSKKTIDESSLKRYYGPYLKAYNVQDFDAQSKISQFSKVLGKYPAYYNRFDIVPRLYSMWYKVQDANRLRKEYEQNYDLIIRARPDCLFKTFNIKEISENILYLPNCQNYRGWNDQFAMGTSSVMETYVNSYDYLDEYIINKVDIGLWAESVVQQQCQKFKIEKRISKFVSYQIVRNSSKTLKYI